MNTADLFDFLKSREDMLRVVKITTPSGQIAYALVFDGYYEDGLALDPERVIRWAMRFGVPAGWPSMTSNSLDG